jgi:MFS superfamily sulfate permease-like transporter
VPDTTIWWPANPNAPGERHPGVAVVGLQAPLSFLNAQNFRADVLGVVKASTPKPRLLVLEASGIIEIDFTAAQTLLDLIRQCRAEGVTVAMARLESTRAQQAFERFRIHDVLPRDHIFFSVDEAVRKLGNGPATANTPL